MDTTHLDRTLEYALELAASPEAVWKAIATPDGLKSWFSYDAKVTPGVGGSVWLAWDDFSGEAPITIWEPPRHIQTTEHRAPFGDDSIAPVDITVDYYIESRDGKTYLRLIHAGMGPEKGWDGEYHATAEDWPWFLQNLLHYVHEHGDSVRQVFSVAVPFQVPASDFWLKLLGTGGEFDGLQEGLPYDLRLFGQEAVNGVVKLLKPRRRFMGTIEALNRAMMVMTVYDKDESSKVVIELSTYDLEEPKLAQIKRQWGGWLRELGGTVPEEIIEA